MSDNIVLEDGRVWWAATISVANVLHEIGIEIGDNNPVLSNWLKDVSDRPAPFMFFDIRGLSQSDIALFYKGASAAFDRMSNLHGEKWMQSNIGDSFNRLLKMRKKILAGEDPGDFSDLDVVLKYDGDEIDLLELWSST